MRRSPVLITSKKGLWLSGPYLVWIVGFTVLPILTIIYYAFTTADNAFTIDNILGAVTDSANIKAFLVTMAFALSATVICLLITYPLAICLTKLRMKRKNFLIFLFILPMWMNFMLQMVAINVLLEDNGVLNTVFEAIGIGKVHIVNTPAAILIGMVYDYLPFMLLPMYNTVSKIDHSLIEAARDLGANPIQTFFKVTFPLSLPGVISGITMVFIPAISDFAIAEMLGGGKILLIGNIVEMNFTKGQYYQGSGLALILMAFVLITSLLTGGSESEGGAVLP